MDALVPVLVLALLFGVPIGLVILFVRVNSKRRMDAMSVPYYPDGGTYTEVLVHLHPQHWATFTPPGMPTQTFVDHTRIPTLAHLGAAAKIFLDPKTARVVLPGVCHDLGYLGAAVASLEQMAHMAMSVGPMRAAS